VLGGESYRRDPEATWCQLMKAWEINDRKIRTVRESLGTRTKPLAMTECHFTVPGRDRGDVNSTWATGVAYARILNNHQRHGDVLKIATAADFCGTRWQNNAVMIPVPKGQGRAYLQPVARVMQLYRHHLGSHATMVKNAPDGLDITASRRGGTLYLHVVNTNRTRAIKTNLRIAGARVRRARIRNCRRPHGRGHVAQQRRGDARGGEGHDGRDGVGIPGGLGVGGRAHAGGGKRGLYFSWGRRGLELSGALVPEPVA
jgi:alpha-N-arabinofuranosidase